LRYFDTLTVPIIENTTHEADLTTHLEQAIKQYPDACAVLVRRHGVYVWGRDWVDAKTMCGNESEATQPMLFVILIKWF
jgi:methylthioribulose-1-phosphate dehydratase